MSLVYFLQRKKVNRYSSMQLECHLGSQNPQSQELPTVYEHGSEVKKKKKMMLYLAKKCILSTLQLSRIILALEYAYHQKGIA